MSAPEIEYVAVSGLKHHPDNPRQGNIDAIAESLEHHGQYLPLIVQRSTSRVLIGNHTLKAAKTLKWRKINVIRADVDDDAALRIMLMDNRSSDSSEYDRRHLGRMLSEIADLAGTGFAQEDVSALLADTADKIQPVGQVEPPAAFIDPESRMGEEQHNCPECGYAWSGRPR